MGISGGPYIVRDSSLVLELDASDLNSYVSGSTTWYDLSGNGYSGSLTNGPTFSSANAGILTFNGINQYITGSNNANFAFGTSNFTVEYWMYMNSITGSIFVDLRSNSATTGPGYSDYVQTGTNKFKLYWSNADRYISTGSLFTGSWYYVASTRQSTTVSVYFNGILDGTSTDNTNLTENGFRLARNVNTSGTGYLSGSIANVQIYNRALSATEVLQNYNALKSRFGL